MKNLLLLFLFYFIISCKSKDEKLRETFIDNASSFIQTINQSEVRDIKLTKIDTITSKKEMLIVSSACIIAAERLQPEVLRLDNQFRDSDKDYKMWAKYDSSGYYYNKRSDDYTKYVDKKAEYNQLTQKAEELRLKAQKNKDKSILRFDVSFKYTLKDSFGMVSDTVITLPFTTEGEIKNLQRVVPEMMKKYNAEFVINYLPDVFNQ